MPPTRAHDPFNDASRRPASRNTHLQEAFVDPTQGPRTTVSARRNLFATTLSRRPTATSTASNSSRLKGPVLEDAPEAHVSRRGIRQDLLPQPQDLPAETEDAEPDLVFRDEKGNFLHEVPILGEHIVGLDDEHREEDARLNAIVREFWAGGGGVSGRGSKRLDEDEYEKPKQDVMARLREAVTEKLTEEKWRFEATDYMESLRVANHGRL